MNASPQLAPTAMCAQLYLGLQSTKRTDMKNDLSKLKLICLWRKETGKVEYIISYELFEAQKLIAIYKHSSHLHVRRSHSEYLPWSLTSSESHKAELLIFKTT